MTWCGWPGTSGSGSAERIAILRPYDFSATPNNGQDNPVLITHTPHIVGFNNWFSVALEFPPESTGGAWAQAVWPTPADLDTTFNPAFVIYWSCRTNTGNVGWQIGGLSCIGDGTDLTTVAPGGGTNMEDNASASNTLFLTSETQIAIGAGAWAANSLLHVNVFRGAPPSGSELAANAYIHAIRIRYQVA